MKGNLFTAILNNGFVNKLNILLKGPGGGVARSKSNRGESSLIKEI